MAEDEEEDYDEAYNQSQTGDEFDRQIPANILDKEYRRKLRPDPRLQFRDARVASPNKLGSQNQPSDEDDAEARDAQVEPAMEQDAILMGVDQSLRLSPDSELVDVKQKSKINRYQRTIKPGIRTRNPATVDEETGGLITDPLIDVNAVVCDSTGIFNVAKFGGGGVVPDMLNDYQLIPYDIENAITKEFTSVTNGQGVITLQFPIRAPRAGEISMVYVGFMGGGTVPTVNTIVYLLDKNVPITTELGDVLRFDTYDRRHIVYQYGTKTAPNTAYELIDTISPPARYVNRDPDPKNTYRLWVRIQGQIDGTNATGVLVGLSIRRMG